MTQSEEQFVSDQAASSHNLKIPFCDNSHWQFGWGDGLYNFDEQHFLMWAKFGHCRYEPKAFDVEIAVAARKVADAARKPIFLGLSGGIDSEVIARTFLKEKIPFTPLIAKFDNDLNQHDIAYAFDFCRANNLTPEVITLDIVAFIENCVNTTYVLNRCPFLFHMHLMRHAASRGGMAVIGLGEQKYKKFDGKIFLPVPIERIAVIHFMQAEGVEGVPAFYCYTPEIIASYLRDAKEIGFKQMGKIAHKLKVKVFQKYWPELALRPKYTGFENVIDLKDAIQAKLLEKYGVKLTQVMIPLDELEEQLSVVVP